jgi:hypothetical protein
VAAATAEVAAERALIVVLVVLVPVLVLVLVLVLMLTLVMLVPEVPLQNRRLRSLQPSASLASSSSASARPVLSRT